MKTKRIALAVIIFLFGLLISLLPAYSGAQLEAKAEQAAAAFYERHIPPNSKTPSSDPTEDGVLLYPELYKAMKEYNDELYLTHQVGLTDAWAYQAPVLELSDYGVDDDVFGTISIPKLSVTLPLYLGASEEHMALGAAQLSQTSFPVSGENTNCVIAGHCGFDGADYFRYLCTMEPGDEVLLTTLWGEEHYFVSETEIIAPDDIDAILIQPGRELLTLLTCHPYASGGQYRFLVFCERNIINGK